MDTLIAQYVERIRAASARGEALRLRGMGSKDFYGQTLQGEVLDLTPLRGIISYEPSELVVTAYAGTPLSEVEALLAQSGQCLAFEPPHFATHPGTLGQGTIGGMVAAGLSGPSRASVGCVRDFVLGVSFINGRGQRLTFGGQVMKNVAGYDVSRLMVGAMGTLGLITQVSLKVLPCAPAQTTLVCAGVPQQAALALLQRWAAQPVPLNASCWVHDASSTPAADTLFVRLRGAAAAVQSAQLRLSQEMRDAGGRTQTLDAQQAEVDWQACCDQQLPFFTAPSAEHGLWRLSVPQTTPALDLPGAVLLEWHGAQRWLWAKPEAAPQLRRMAAERGGSATLFRAPQAGAASAVERFHPLTEALAQIHLRLKAEFDPAAVFNRQRLGTAW